MAVEHDYLSRTAVSDSSLNNGRYALLGTEEPAGVLVSVTLNATLEISNYRGGALCRYVSTEKWLALVKTSYAATPGAKPQWELLKRTPAGVTTLASGSMPVSTWGTLAVFVGKDGVCKVYLDNDTSSPDAETTADADLATGGQLAKGKYGIYDAYTAATAKTRQYRNFSVTLASTDPVLFASLDARLTSQGHFRRSADNKAYGPVFYPGSDLPRIPVSGPEERPVEIGFRMSRGDFGMLADAGLDKGKGALTYRPCWSFVPEE